MNCANHPERSAAAFCRECGKALCEECRRPALNSVYCEEHVPVPPPLPRVDVPPVDAGRGSAYAGSSYATGSGAGFAGSAAPSSPYAQAPYPAVPGTPLVREPHVHPVLALILGFLPGVGAIYNGQYAKGLVHAVVFGLLISLANSTHHSDLAPFVGIMIAIWVIYQAFEAYHTARKRRYGVEVEEFSSLFDVRYAHGRFPFSAILLIGAGFILLLDTTDIISIDRFLRYWPVLLVAAGVYLLYARLNPAEHTGHTPVSDDRMPR